MKRFILVVLTLVLTLGIFFSIASPASACIPGRSPGYFKNHPESWPSIYDPDKTTGTTIGEAFAIDTADNYDDMTLMAALNTNGNKDGKAAFWRQAVAALLHQWGDPNQIDFLQRLVNEVYPDGGEFVNTIGPFIGTFGDDWWTLEDWKNSFFEPLNNQ